jgi:hypothetical protein
VLRRRNTVVSTLTAIAALTIGVAVSPLPALGETAQNRLTAVVPSTSTPDVLNGAVETILEVGNKVIAGGTFTQVSNNSTPGTVLTRNYIFAFDKSTNVIDTAFVPTFSGEVKQLRPGPTAGTFYAAGQFTTVNGVTQNRVVLMNASNGSIVSTFKPPTITGIVNDLAITAGHMIIGGAFAKIGGIAHSGIGSLNPTTGALDPWMNIQLTGHHNYDGTGANGGVGAKRMALAPNGTKLAVVGNFKTANGGDYDQAVLVDLTGGTPAIADWQTNAFDPRCASWAFDSWIRNVDFAPDSSYFVISTTGAAFPGTTCDTVTRWEANATGTDLKPTWTTYSGGDTFMSAISTGVGIYVGGHFRWLNNSFGTDSPAAGAVGRASIGVLDPRSGLPLSWNPGRNDRGPAGVYVMYPVADGLWMGYDTDWLGQHQWKDQRIGFFPLSGGLIPPTDSVPTLPGNVYLAGQAGGANTGILYRVNSGGPAIPAADNGPDWAADTDFTSPYRNSGSNTAAFGTVANVAGTVPSSTPRAIFDDERWDPGDAPEMQWAFPVTTGKQIKVRLYLANRYSGTSQVGQRVFNVAIDGTPVLTNYDIVADVGDQVATMKEFTITSDGTVNIDFGHVVENPLIDGIEIVDPSVVPPPPGTSIFKRSYDGASAVGSTLAVSNPDGTLWDNSRSGFYVNGKLFYGMSDGTLMSRTFNGTTWGPASLVDPYHDNDGINPDWDTVQTGSGQTYAGIPSNFYSQITSVTGMAYQNGKLFYTLFNQDGLYWRWFLPENGVVGADQFTVAGASGFSGVRGMFTANNTLYTVNGATGDLSSRSFVAGVPGAPTVVSGPLIDGNDWHARALFVAP